MTTQLSRPVDGFRLAYEVDEPDAATDAGAPIVVLLHGWPGDRNDYRELRPLLAPSARLVVPDLRGFGESDKHDEDPSRAYDAAAQARSVVGLLDDLEVGRAVLVGYDVGSRVAQQLARSRPDRVAGMVLAPPLPGAGDRVLTAEAQAEFWYQSFHQLDLAERLLDGRPDAVRDYLAHFWTHWSGPSYEVEEQALDALTERYAAPGAYRASIGWYRAGAGTIRQSLTQQTPAREDRIETPTTVLWPEHDPLFPRAWSDRLEEFFADATLHEVDGVGHFAPLEYPAAIADAVRAITSTPTTH